MKTPRTVLICHHDEPLNRFGLTRWLASFSDLAAVIVVRQPPGRLLRRVRREIQRVGLLRFLDVLAFRLYYKLFVARTDAAWIQATLDGLLRRYADLPASCRILQTASPNSAEALALLREVQPELILARCKNILREDIFKTASRGTFVMHPGVCPEYRNAHGCFWALAQRDLNKVGMTLLRVGAGVDTGPVYGYFGCAFDERRESHMVIQSRVVFDNLDALRAKFEEIVSGAARPLDTAGRSSRAWGQPWLTSYIRWKRAARKEPGKGRATTLLFHDVVPAGRWEVSGFQGAGADTYKLDCDEFRRHLAAIHQKLRGRVATAAEILAAPPADTPVLLTFDDGGASAEYIAGMLEEFGWRGHFLVTTGRIGTAGFLDASQVRELRRRGHVVGSHSCTHPPRMNCCAPAEMDLEWRKSVLALSDILGEPVEVASVPGGYYSRAVAASAARAGIRLLFNSEPVTRPQTVDGCLVLGRFTAQHGFPPGWSASIAAGDRQLHAREYLFWNFKKLAKAMMGSAWLRFRVLLLERRARHTVQPGS